MIPVCWTTWRRDVVVGGLASVLTASVLVPSGWAALLDEREQAATARQLAQADARLAEQRAADAEQQRALGQWHLVEQAADFAGLGDQADAAILRVTTAAVAPEIPQGAHRLIDKKAAAYAVGDIVIYAVAGKNYLGRVLAVEQAAGRLTIGRNGEANRQVPCGDVLGRGVLNTR